MDNVVLDKDTHIYKLGKSFMPGVSGILKKAGVGGDFSTIDQDLLERAIQFGKAVHFACELHDKKTLDIATVDQPVLHCLTAWKKFVKDFNVKMLEIEQPIYSKKWWVAGMPDRIALVKGILTLIDIKTSKTIYPQMQLQTAGYQMMYEELRGKKIKQRLIVRLAEDGYKITKLANDEENKSVFIACVQVSKWKKINIKERSKWN